MAKLTLELHRKRKLPEGYGDYPCPSHLGRSLGVGAEGRDFDLASVLANVTLEQCVVSYTLKTTH